MKSLPSRLDIHKDRALLRQAQLQKDVNTLDASDIGYQPKPALIDGRLVGFFGTAVPAKKISGGAA